MFDSAYNPSNEQARFFRLIVYRVLISNELQMAKLHAVQNFNPILFLAHPSYFLFYHSGIKILVSSSDQFQVAPSSNTTFPSHNQFMSSMVLQKL